MEGRAGEGNALATFGSYPTGAKVKKGKKSMSQYGDIDEEHSRYIILEERSFHSSTRELRNEDALELERAQATKQDGW